MRIVDLDHGNDQGSGMLDATERGRVLNLNLRKDISRKLSGENWNLED
jgi:hypothetical protein